METTPSSNQAENTNLNTTACSNCNQSILKEEKFCGHCGFPEHGSEKEKDKFNYSKHLKESVIKDAKKKLKNVQILLYVLAGINFLAAIYYFLLTEGVAEVIASAFSCAIFIGCALWVDKNPLMAVISAFGFWIIIQVISIIVEPEAMFKGILWKILFISIFIKGIKSAIDYKDFTARLKQR